MITRASLALTMALALGASPPARAQITRGCRCVPFQQALSVEVVPGSDWETATHTARFTVPSWAVLEIEAVSTRGTPPVEGSLQIYGLAVSTLVGGVRATHFNTPPIPPATIMAGGGIIGGVLVAPWYGPAVTSSTTALYAAPGSEVIVSADAWVSGTSNGKVEWTLSGRLVTANASCTPTRW
jgi:hypothetical protein